MPDREAKGRPGEASDSADQSAAAGESGGSAVYGASRAAGDSGGSGSGAAGVRDAPGAPASATDPPIYKGAPLDADCGPGLGCFWIQIGTLVALLILTPLTVILAFPPWVSAALLILSLVILFFVGQTSIFLLRLVAADRRAARRVPRSATARRTVGQLEDENAASMPSDQDEVVTSRSDEDHTTPR